ncbi:hypothetical protein M413DRAFT_447283 [Hebeloma cylindrosporum]|uniref:Uncharacterized protein n=1 Tax=Hebeloma cylindrosporum TaxID=76867 RepID=A0A0C3BRN1_HEBCY|nr:hypothetical protein M413DRAFT_447283 [Hebeloma cylindrosporum h7]
MPAPTAFLAPYPPNLFHIAESQALSGSSASFSSTSSATSAFFDRLSRASSASAYLTDLTPPITPSHSNLDNERKQGDQQSKPPKHDSGAQQESTPKDSRHHLVRSILRSDDDLGYRSDAELEGADFDAVDALRTRLRRSKQTLNSRRALKIMEMRDTPLSSMDDDDDDENDALLGTASPPMDVEGNPVEDWSGDFELRNSQAQLNASPGISELQRDNHDGSATHIWPTQPYVECDDSIHEPLLENLCSPNLPPKPTIQAMDLDWECSPYSLGSAASSPSSICHLLGSPLQIDATGTMSSPAIYNSSIIGSHSPSQSPLATISNLMFSSRIRHVPGALTGDDLPVADLMRLEVSAAQTQAESTPSRLRLPVGLGFEMPSPTSQISITVLHPHQYEAHEGLSPSASDGENLIDLDSPGFSHYDQLSEISLDIPLDGDLVEDKENAQLMSPLGVGEIRMEVVEEKIISNERSDNAGREFAGLGLGGLAGASLQSSGSISRLFLVPSPSAGKLSGDRAMESSSFNNMFDEQYCSPGIKDRSESMSYSGIIPRSALLESVHARDFNLDHMSVSPLQTEFLLPLPHEDQLPENIPDAFSDDNVSAKKSPGIEQPPALLEEKIPLCPSQRVVPTSRLGLVGSKVLKLPSRFSSVYGCRSPTETSPMLLTPENDPRSPCSPTEDYFSLEKRNSQGQNAEDVNSQDQEPLASTSLPVISSVVADQECPEERASDPILRPSKSAEGLGMGLPSNVANQHRGYENMTSAEGCMDLNKLACTSSPHEDLAADSSFEGSKDSVGSARFAKRRLYDIPEFLTPPIVHETTAPAPTPSSSRLLNTAWASLGLFNRLSSSRSNHSWISSDSASRGCGLPTSSSTREGDRSPLHVNTDLCPPLKMSTSTLPLPPTPPAQKVRLWMSRSPISGSSLSVLNSNLSPVEACSTSGGTSPAVVEHTQVPRGLGIFRRNNSSQSPKVGKVNRFKPVIRKLQLLF